MTTDPSSCSPYADGMPDTSDPAFIEEYRRQLKLIRDNAEAEKADMDFIEAVTRDLWDACGALGIQHRHRVLHRERAMAAQTLVPAR